MAHLAALLQQSLDLGMYGEILRIRTQRIRDIDQFSDGYSGSDFILRLVRAAGKAVPVSGQSPQRGLAVNGLSFFLGIFKFRSQALDQWRGIQPVFLRVNLPQRRMLFDLL